MRFLTAVRFLTALPLPPKTVKPEEMGQSMAYFPLVGLLIGIVAVGVDLALQAWFSPAVASAGVILTLILLSGGLHLDGLMDCCDGLFGRSDPARRLEIMKDSRVGSFGVLGAIGILLLKFAALGSLTGLGREAAIALVPVLGRWSMVMSTWGFPYARPQGLGFAFKQSVRWPQLVLASLWTVLIAILLLPEIGIIAFGVAAVATWALARFICTRIPGLTGDSYGAISEMVEVLALLTVLALK